MDDLFLDEPAISRFVRGHDEPGIEVRVNFGVFAGRHATPAEIDEFAGALRELVPSFAIVSEERHEMSEDVEIVLHQVRIAVPPDHVPEGSGERRAFCVRLVTLAEIWARQCINERHAEITEL